MSATTIAMLALELGVPAMKIIEILTRTGELTQAQADAHRERFTAAFAEAHWQPSDAGKSPGRPQRPDGSDANQ